MKYNGKPTFDIVAIRSKPNGFEIEFTEPIKEGFEMKSSDFRVEQWWYLPTPNYGGPKMDQEQVPVTSIVVSTDRNHILLEIPGLKEEHVIYFRLPGDLQSAGGRTLWSSEAWYTLNNIPK